MFVHDFVPVDRPACQVVADLACRIESMLGPLLWAVWANGRDIRCQLGLDHVEPVATDRVQVCVGPPRIRPDAVIVPITWEGGDKHPRLPSLEADLEVASWGPDVTHLHLLGRYRLPPEFAPWTAEASLAHRAMVVVVRRFLESLAGELERGIPAPRREPSGYDR